MSPFDPAPLDTIWPAWARSPDVALAATLYDLIPLQFPQDYLPSGARIAYEQRLSLLRRADAVLAISDSVAEDAVSLGGIDERRITVVGAASPGALNRTAPALIPVDQRDCILCVSGGDPRKNTARLIEAYAALPPSPRERHALVIVGELGPTLGPLIGLAKRLRVIDRVMFLGVTSDAHLAGLYRACRVFVCPSLAEGFGLPVLEALESKAQILVSDVPALRSFAPLGHQRFDPTSVPDIAGCLERTLTRPAQRASEVGAHRWRDVVAKSEEAYGQAIEAREIYRRRRVHRSRRLLLVTPLPPARSGIATYSDALARELRAIVPLTVHEDERWRELDGVPRRARASAFNLHRASSLGEETVLHCLGGSRYHMDSWRLLMSRGGDVLLHDVWLAGLYAELGAARDLPDDHAVWASSQLQDFTSTELSDRSLFMTGEVLDRARRVLVHSEAARALILQQRPNRADDVRVVPFGHPHRAPALVREDATRAVIACFGYLRGVAEEVLRALIPVLKDRPGVQLTFVGGVSDPRESARVRAISTRHGIERRVEITGWLDDGGYARRLTDAAVAVQIRTRFHGESSAALSDCLAAGVPTVVNDFGVAHEIPDECAVKVSATPTGNELGTVVSGLLDDSGRRLALHEAARAYAGQRSMAAAAAAAVSAVFG